MKCPFCGTEHEVHPCLNIMCSCGGKYYIHNQEWWDRTTGEKMSQRVREGFLALGYTDAESIRLAKVAMEPVTTSKADVFCESCFWCNICSDILRQKCKKDGTHYNYKSHFSAAKCAHEDVDWDEVPHPGGFH